MMEFMKIIEALPKDPQKFWTNGEEILCETEDTAETIADFLECLIGVDDICTGFFDPEEDKNNEINECTGFYYVNTNG